MSYGMFVMYSFDCLASLHRIASAVPDVDRMRAIAISEREFMTFYRLELPQQTQLNVEGCSRHNPSVCLLREQCAWLLTRYQPVDVGGDGNCLFRSVSRALYADEGQHVLLRLLTVVELLMSAELYDKTDPNFYQPYKCDPYLVVPSYDAVVCETVRDGAYSDMLTVLGVSAVVQKAIQTFWPITVHPGQQSPMTKLVIGRDVNNTRHPLYILWTVSQYVQDAPSDINHFVPLVEIDVVPAKTTAAVPIVNVRSLNINEPCLLGELFSCNLCCVVPVLLSILLCLFLRAMLPAIKVD